MKIYFLLQYKIISRKIWAMGVYPLAALILVGTGFLAFSHVLFEKVAHAPYLYILIPAGIISTSMNGARRDFLRTTAGELTYKKIRVFENLLIGTPFLLFLCWKTDWLAVSFLLALTVLMSFTNPEINLPVAIPTPFSRRPFEFTSGFRSALPLFAGAVVLTAIAVGVNNMNLGIVVLFSIFLVSAGFYTKPEQEFYVWVYKYPPAKFLWNKIIAATWQSNLLAAPFLLVLLISWPHSFVYILLAAVAGYLLLVTVILAHYSAWPGEMNLAQVFLLALGISFPPALLAVIPYFYFRSREHLQPYLS